MLIDSSLIDHNQATVPNEGGDGGGILNFGGNNAGSAHLIVRNSLSEKWGDKGYFYMPYDFAKSGKAMDWWAAQ